MPAKGSTTKATTADKSATEDEPEASNTQPGAASLDEALAASARPPEPEPEEVERSVSGMADESEFEPLDDVPPTEVSSTDERPISE